MTGLRERKRARTRAHIAATAAGLFAEHGYENTSVAQVARAAEVSEQTVYNYFPAKRNLVLDREDEVRERFVAAVRDRAPGTSPAGALRAEALALADGLSGLTPEQARGSIGHLALSSPAVRSLVLEAVDRIADALADALVATTEPPPSPPVAKLQGIALAWLSQTVVDESGRLVRDGLAPDEIAGVLRPLVSDVADRLDAWWAAGS